MVVLLSSNRFVGLVHTTPCLSHCIDTNHKVINLMTREQLKILLTSRPKQWIVGPAGSGKTWLLQEKVLELAHRSLIRDENTDGNKILVLCYNRPLHQHLKNQFRSRLEAPLQGEDVASVIDVMTYSKFLSDHLDIDVQLSDFKKKSLISQKYTQLQASAVPKSRYRHIFVDEGQDLYSPKWPELLQLFLQKDEDEDDEPHFLWVMYDSNQHIQPSAENFQCFQQYLKNSSQLPNVLRNTENIFDMSKKYYSSVMPSMCPELRLGHNIVGHNVVLDDSLPELLKLEKGAQLVADHVRRFESQNVQMRDICILTTEKTTRNRLTKELDGRKIPCQNAEQHILTEVPAVIVESIRRFKGLESKVVILFDPLNAKSSLNQQSIGLLYSAISRCCCYLLILSTKIGCQLLQSNLIGNLLPSMHGTSRKRGPENTSRPTEVKKPALVAEQEGPV